jgi:hypothetical protein
MQRPKINKTNELKVISEHRFEKLFCNASGFDPMKVPQEHDYGIDYIVRLIDKNNNVLSECFITQLKSTTKIRIKERMIKLGGFPVKTLNLLREEVLPAYIFLYNHCKGEMYYCKIEAICEILDKKNKNWSQQKTATIYFPCNNLVNEEKINSIYAETQRICQQISKTRNILDVVSILKKYANIDVKISEKEQNINILSAQKGFGVNIQLALEDARKFQESFTQGKPFSASVKDGTAQFTFNKRLIYESRNIAKIEINPRKGRRKIKFKIPNNNYEIGPFDIIVRKRKSEIIGETEKESLPWSFNFKLDIENKKTAFNFKFYPEFSSNEQFLKYLNFMKYLESPKKCEMIDLPSEKTLFTLNVESAPIIENWRIEFVTNINIIEKHTNKTFDLNNKVRDEEVKQAYIYSNLIKEGRCNLNTNKAGFTMLGNQIKNQISQLLSKAKLNVKGRYEGSICGEEIAYDFEFCLENAELNEEVKKLLKNPEMIEDNREYKLEFISNEKAYMIHMQ